MANIAQEPPSIRNMQVVSSNRVHSSSIKKLMERAVVAFQAGVKKSLSDISRVYSFCFQCCWWCCTYCVLTWIYVAIILQNLGVLKYACDMFKIFLRYDPPQKIVRLYESIFVSDWLSDCLNDWLSDDWGPEIHAWQWISQTEKRCIYGVVFICQYRI